MIKRGRAAGSTFVVPREDVKRRGEEAKASKEEDTNGRKKAKGDAGVMRMKAKVKRGTNDEGAERECVRRWMVVDGEKDGRFGASL